MDILRLKELKKTVKNRLWKNNFSKNKLLIDSGWEGLKEKEILFFYN